VASVSGPPSKPTFTRIASRLIHAGKVFRVEARTYRAPDGRTVDREVVVHPGAVSVVPLIEGPGGPAAVLVRQFRAAIEVDLLEIPAGKRDVEDEPPELTAHRELAEEVGYTAGRLVPLARYFNTPGFSDEFSHAFLALDLRPVAHDRQGLEEELMSIEHVPLADVRAMIAADRIVDAKTIIGLLLAIEHVRVD
jgi:ADP-ribose pyrophosphatase